MDNQKLGDLRTKLNDLISSLNDVDDETIRAFAADLVSVVKHDHRLMGLAASAALSAKWKLPFGIGKREPAP